MAMRLAVTYTLYATSSKEQTGDVITFTQFEEGNILTKTRNDAESGEESDSESIMMNKQDMKNIDSNEKSNHNLISTEMLQDICDVSQTYPNINKKEARYEIRDRVRQRQLEWKGVLRATHKMVIKDIINKDVDPTTPHKLATGTKPSVSHLRVLFCPCFVSQATEHVYTKTLNMRHQAQKGCRGILVGIPDHQKGYLVYVPSTRKVISSHKDVFDKSVSSELS